MLKNIIDGPDFFITGELPINRENLIKQWNDNCFLSQWKDEFTLCERYKRRKKPHFQVSISRQDAGFIIRELNLVRTQSSVFNSAGSWRKTVGER